MESNEKIVGILSRVRWLCPVPAVIMYMGTIDAFGSSWATALGLIFMLGFYYICNRERRLLLCESIVTDIREELKKVGHETAVYELRSLRIGIVVRVYLIKAGSRAHLCNRAVLSVLTRGWYRKFVSATQIVDLDSEVDIKEAKISLDEDLLDDLKERVARGKKDDK